MTLEELKNLDVATINPIEAAEILHMNPSTLRATARENPQKLGFPVIVTNTRIRIPREAFIKFLAGE